MRCVMHGLVLGGLVWGLGGPSAVAAEPFDDDVQEAAEAMWNKLTQAYALAQTLPGDYPQCDLLLDRFEDFGSTPFKMVEAARGERDATEEEMRTAALQMAAIAQGAAGIAEDLEDAADDQDDDVVEDKAEQIAEDLEDGAENAEEIAGELD